METLMYSSRSEGSSSEAAAALLFHAATNGDLEDLVSLLDSGLIEVNYQNSLGDTALHFAVSKGLSSTVELLLSYHADPNIQNKKAYGSYSPLHLATKRDDVRCVEVLLNHGANPNLRDSLGFTCLHIAAKEGLTEIGKLLILKGADLEAKDNDLKTPYYWAHAFRNTELKSLLPATSYDWMKAKAEQFGPIHTVAPPKPEGGEKKAKKGKKGKKGGGKKKKKKK